MALPMSTELNLCRMNDNQLPVYSERELKIIKLLRQKNDCGILYLN